MEVSEYIRALQKRIQNETLQLGDHDGVIDLLCESYLELQKPDEHLDQGFDVLNQVMNSMEMDEMDKIIYTVCDLCQEYQRNGFTAGIKVAAHLLNELQ